MTTIAFILISGLILICIGIFTYEEIRIRKEARRYQQELETANNKLQQQEANNEIKEEMETGSATADFNNSIDILQHLNKNKRK